MVRLRHRYVICQILPDYDAVSDFAQRDILMAIREKIQILNGDIGTGIFGSSFSAKLFDDKMKIIVLRISRDFEMQTRLAISCVNLVKRSSVTIRILGVTSCGRTTTDKLNALFSRIVEQSENSELSEKLKAHYANLLSNSPL